MNIKEVINLWDKSKYDRLMIKSLPCVNHDGEITRGTGIYTKNQTILCGGEYNVEDYLMKIYEDCIFKLEYVEDYISFEIIMRTKK